MDAAHKLTKFAAFLFLIALLTAIPGSAQTLVANPPSVSLAGTAGQNVSITSSGAAITYTIGTNYTSSLGANPGWLQVVGATTTPATLVFNIVTAAGLAAGTHTADVTLTPTSPTGLAPITIGVTYTSGSTGGGSSTLTASPNPINLSAAVGASASQAVVISTTSGSIISIGVAAAVNNGGTNWLSASITGNGSLVSGTPTSLSVTANAASLANGSYTGTVTVTPSSGTALVIPVNFTVGSGSTGNGSWTLSPSPLPNLTFNTNSGSFPSTSFTVNTTSGFSTYNVTATSSNGWLLVNGSPVSNGLTVGNTYTLSVGNQANVLDTGSYTGNVTIFDPNGTQQISVPVNLSVNGGNSTGLTISPNPLTLSAAVGGGQQSTSVSVTSSTGGTLSVAGTPPSWLSFTLPSNTNIAAGGSAAFTVFVNPANLSAGTYSGSLTVTVGSQSATFNVTLTVGGGSTGGSGSTVVAPTSLAFTYQFGTLPNFIAQQKIVITGPTGSWSSNITTTDNGSWLKLSPPNGGSVPDPTNSPVAYIDPTGLAPGNYSGDIAITTVGGTSHVTASLTVTSSPVLIPTPGDLVFNAQTGQSIQGQSVFFSSSDSSTVGLLNITATPNQSWITVTNSASSMVVNVNPSGMAAGVYSGSITVSQNNVANGNYTYPVIMVVNGGGSGSTGPLTFNPASLSFSVTNGVVSPSTSTLAVGANVATNFTYTTSVSGGVANWLAVGSAASGSGTTTTNLSVSANPNGLAAGTYNGTISFNSSGGVIQTVPVTLTVNGSSGTGGNVTVSPTSLTFSGQVGSGSPAAQSIAVSSASGTAAVTYSVTATTTSGGSWLTTTANPTQTTPSSFNVNVNTTGLAAGSYTGNIAIQPTGGTVANVPVSFTVTALPTVSATPATLTFDYRAGDSNPASQPITVSGGGASLAFTAAASSNGNWLAVTPTTGTTPGTVNVSINPAGLSAGSYTGTVTIAGANGATGSSTTTVTLTVTAPLPTITKVTNAASYATGSISPGEIITLFAGDPAHPIGPATAVGAAFTDANKTALATTIGGVQVLINGFPAPMIFASATQVSAVVPYEISLFTNATVQVKFLGQTSNGVPVNVSTTAPGIFTANSSGTGPGAILNSNSGGNAPSNPATRGDTVVVYLTGEGQTSPAGVTGKVTTVASTGPLTPTPLLPVSVTVGGQAANFSFAGEAPGLVSGVLQLNVQLPTNIGTGEQEIIVSIGGNQSQRGVTVSVK